jgi:predicted  nucleic acid-binding Zn-ribbon protein
MDKDARKASVMRIRKVLDAATTEAIRADLGDIATRLKAIRDEVAAIENELSKDERQLSVF